MFVGLQIRNFIQNVKFEDRLKEVEKQHGNHSKLPLLILGEIIRQKTV
jgi:hypothetical protein